MTPALLAPMASTDAHAAATAAIAAAKERWQMACWDGSGAGEVQRLYEAYRDLVIARIAALTGRAAVRPSVHSAA